MRSAHPDAPADERVAEDDQVDHIEHRGQVEEGVDRSGDPHATRRDG
ncbi:hypothetical protein [Ornithinimicrobium sediminis]|nr:hypothetical protein [Ornithinimicrobium sediminis]MCE0486729.1 hypothetical protein [Ornithinimicrobium sediminis]